MNEYNYNTEKESSSKISSVGIFTSYSCKKTPTEQRQQTGVVIAQSVRTGYDLDSRGDGVQVPIEARFFSSSRRPDRFRGPTQPPIKWVPGALSPEVKRQKCEADH
jgi:hypothetical protein